MIYIIGQMGWKLQGVSYIVSICHEFWSTNSLKLDLHFTHPPYILHSTSLSGFADKRPASETQPNLRRRVNRANNLQ